MNQILLPLILVLAFLGVVALVQGLAGMVFASRDRAARVNRRLAMLASGMESREVYEALVRRPATPAVSSALARRLFEATSRTIAQAGISMPLPRLAATVAGLAVVIWLLAIALMRQSGLASGLPETLVALFGAVTLTGLGVWFLVSSRRRKRLRQLETQLPLALDIIIRALKAGHPVISAVGLVPEEMGDPIGSEFGLIVDETTYGADFRQALASFARRTGSDDAHFLAVSIAIQNDTGGNLAEILANLSSVMRARQMLGKRIKALSSEGRMSGLILSGLPLLLIGVIGMTQPTFYTAKFSDPIFWPTVVVILLLYGVGLLMMRRITNFKY